MANNKSANVNRNNASNGNVSNTKQEQKSGATLKIPNQTSGNHQAVLRGSYSSNRCGSENDKTESTAAGEKFMYDGESGQMDRALVQDYVTPQKEIGLSSALQEKRKLHEKKGPLKANHRYQNYKQYQKTISNQSASYTDDLDDISLKKQSKKRSSAVSSPSSPAKVVRGNLGFCPLDMSLVNLCGLPSLWLDPKEFATGGSKRTINCYDQPERVVHENYIKVFQRKLIKKQYKVYELLRFHRIFESEKYFGRSLNNMHNQQHQAIFQDFYFFSTDFLKDNNKYQLQQLQQGWDAVYKTGQFHNQTAVYTQQSQLNIVRDKPCVLQILCSSQEVVQPELPVILEPEAATFKLVNSEAKILKQILTSQGLSQTDQNEWNLLWTSVSLQNKPQIYEAMQDHQKINHFQYSTELTRKDRYADNMRKMKEKYGFYQFDFAPETYSLPEEMAEFQKRFEAIQNDESDDYGTSSSHSRKRGPQDEEDDNSSASNSREPDNCWIVKPSQSSQGKGIYLIEDPSELQQTTNPYNDKLERTVVCKYIGNPLLINNHKFDLRIYVLLTSVDPLRIYVYNEGLARFASEPYDSTTKGAKKNLYSHLTNYSINKKSETFQQNKSVLERDHGNKWSMSALQSHLESLGINMQPIWERIYDAIIKSLIAVEPQLQGGLKKILSSGARQNCFELFGFDILLDSYFKPHVLEVNFSPSLSADSPLDYHIKSNLLVDTLNLVGLKRNPKKRGTNNSLAGAQRFRTGGAYYGGQMNTNPSLGFIQVNQAYSRRKNSQYDKNGGYPRSHSQTEMRNFASFLNGGNIDQYFLDRLSKISAKHRELVFETLDEFQRNKNMNYTCIYPAPGSQLYDKFFVQPRPSNQVVHRYLFTKNEFYTITKQIDQYQRQTQALMDSQTPDQNKDLKFVSGTCAIDNDILRESDDEDSDSRSSASSDNQAKNTKKGESGKAVRSSSRKQSVSKEPTQSQQAPNIVIEESQSTTQTPGLSTKANSGAPAIAENSSKINANSTSLGERAWEPKTPKKNTEVTRNPEIIQHTPSPSPSQEISKQDSADQHPKRLVPESSTVKPTQEPARPEPDSRVSIQSPVYSACPIALTGSSKKQGEGIKLTEEQSPSCRLMKVEENDSPGRRGTKHSPTNGPSNEINLQSFDTPATPAEEAKGPSPAETVDKKEKTKMVITGDDILIEYVHRIVKLMDTIMQSYRDKLPTDLRKKSNDRILTKIQTVQQEAVPARTGLGEVADTLEDILPDQIRHSLEMFARHKIWSTKFSGSEEKMPLSSRIRKRHTEMVDRRARILKSTLKKQVNPALSAAEIAAQLEKQDQSRDKIVNRISSQKIEKMVKQSNVENKIDIVSILVEGTFNLPDQMQTSSGKSVIKGTLQSLKLFEKIIKQTDYAEKIAKQLIDQREAADRGNLNNRTFEQGKSRKLPGHPNSLGQSENQYLLRLNQNQQCVASIGEFPGQGDSFKKSLNQISKHAANEMNKSVGNTANQSYYSESYQIRRENQNNSRGKIQIHYLERTNNAVGASHVIQSGEAAKAMGQSMLDGKAIGLEQSNQRHSLILSDQKLDPGDGQTNPKPQRISSLFQKEHMAKQHKTKNNRNSLYQNQNPDMIRIVENNNQMFTKQKQNYALVISESNEKRSRPIRINQTTMLQHQVSMKHNNRNPNHLEGLQRPQQESNSANQTSSMQFQSPQNRVTNAAIQFERNRSKFSVAFNGQASTNEGVSNEKVEESIKYTYKKQQTQQLEHENVFGAPSKGDDAHSYQKCHTNSKIGHRNLVAADAHTVNLVNSYGQANDPGQQTGSKNRMLSFDSSQQNINASLKNNNNNHSQNTTSNQIPYFSVPGASREGIKNLRKNSQNLTSQVGEDKGIVLPLINNNNPLANTNYEKSNSQIPSRSNLKRNMNQNTDNYSKSVNDNNQIMEVNVQMPLSSSGMSNQFMKKPSSSQNQYSQKDLHIIRKQNQL